MGKYEQQRYEDLRKAGRKVGPTSFKGVYKENLSPKINKGYDSVRVKHVKSKIRARPNKRLIEDVFN